MGRRVVRKAAVKEMGSWPLLSRLCLLLELTVQLDSWVGFAVLIELLQQ